jgi:hypothetical protein
MGTGALSKRPRKVDLESYGLARPQPISLDVTSAAFMPEVTSTSGNLALPETD